MNRPLIVTDCDEVLLHMIAPFRDWLAQDEGVLFDISKGNFAKAMTYRDSGALVGEEGAARLLNLFFDGQMHRQTPIVGAVAAIGALREQAEVVVLTNLKDFRQEARRQQLRGHGLDLRVFTNQGPKGPALKAILDEYRPSRAIFIDDIAQHHGSAAELTPHVQRLHLCAEPTVAPHITCAHAAGNAHARIDDWASALPWLLDRLNLEETP
jgi:FMN phosphatase YigB (HAD superfamily)